MHYWLQQAVMPVPEIEVIELERKHIGATPISASLVRKLWQEQEWEKLSPLVPESTLALLKRKESS